jgi:tRNA A-37 threonylcarbamoyl transferase component Bud32
VTPPPETREADDETRLGHSPGTGGSAPTTGWLTSSGAIDHGRFPPGTLLGGRYRIVGRLGKGGMGEVYRADDLKLGQQVALKFLPPDVDRDAVRLSQLHSEVRMARQVSHPNVCRVYDIDEVEGHTFLSMEFVDGEDLATLLRRIGRFNEERGIEIARQMCAGLAAAHQRGVIHRDFKPANVMIDRAGSVRITDFGLAGSPGETIAAGTPAYMAPEQLAGGAVTAASDVYALGLVLYELFTGKRAIEAGTLAELIRRREQDDLVPPSAITRDISPEVDRVVLRCLALEPVSRPSSALAVSAALPGGDPLAAALAAGETPSPEMVAAAGETSGLSRAAGLSLLAFIVFGLIATAVIFMRHEVTSRVPLEKSVDVLTERAKEIITLAGYTARPADTARGAGFTSEYTSWIAQRDPSSPRWDLLNEGHGPVLRFWYRISPRSLDPLATGAWSTQINDPPIDASGMATVVVDERGRLLQFVAMPPQKDASGSPVAMDWGPFFTQAGLSQAAFSAVAPEWTPRVFADSRVAWDGPMPGWPQERLRVEAASYAGRPVSFQLIWPWTIPTRMEQTATSSGLRALSVAGTLFLIVLLVGAIALVRYNLRSGRSDQHPRRRHRAGAVQPQERAKRSTGRGPPVSRRDCVIRRVVGLRRQAQLRDRRRARQLLQSPGDVAAQRRIHMALLSRTRAVCPPLLPRHADWMDAFPARPLFRPSRGPRFARGPGAGSLRRAALGAHASGVRGGWRRAGATTAVERPASLRSQAWHLDAAPGHSRRVTERDAGHVRVCRTSWSHPQAIDRPWHHRRHFHCRGLL